MAEYSIYLSENTPGKWILMHSNNIERIKSVDATIVIDNVDIKKNSDVCYVAPRPKKYTGYKPVWTLPMKASSEDVIRKFDEMFDTFILYGPGFEVSSECQNWWEQQCEKKRIDPWKDYILIIVWKGY